MRFAILFAVFAQSAFADLKLPICRKKQDGTQWCWAACAQDMASRRGIELSQPEIVRKAKSLEFDAKVPNEPGDVDDALTACGIPSHRKSGRMGASEIRSHLVERQTVSALLRLPGKKVGHYVVIFGISDDDKKLWIWDPEKGQEAEMSIGEITAKWGEWTHTHYSRKPLPVETGRDFPRHRSSLNSSSPTHDDNSPK